MSTSKQFTRGSDIHRRRHKESLWKSAWRLFRVAKKPDREEMWLVVKVTALGMGFMGLMGFLIRLIFNALAQSFGA